MSKSKKKLLSRVDLQVSIFASIIICLCSLSAFTVCYQISSREMLYALSERSYAVANYLNATLDLPALSEINQYEDIEKTPYHNAKEIMEQIKGITGLRYLYTAKEYQGELIYGVDGLSMEEDFRYPGDPIEKEILEPIYQALGGEVVLPDKIASTDWGNIYTAYFPIYQDKEAIAVIGMEFDAEYQYNTLQTLKIVAVIIIILFTGMASAVSVYCFRRISNPTFRDLYNTDQLTQLKSRNAFEMDLKNAASVGKLEGRGFVMIDLNNLKMINDSFGHEKGDEYIKLAANAIEKVCSNDMAAYRIGGDEFVVLTLDLSLPKLENLCNKIQRMFELIHPAWMDGLALAVGCAEYDKKEDYSLMDAYKRADARMYENKIHLKGTK